MTGGLSVAIGLLLGHAADRSFGDPRRGHPVALFGSAMLAVEERVWADRRAPGAAYTAAGLALGAGPVLLLDRGTRTRPVARTALTAAVTWAALGGRSLAGAGRDIGALVAAGDLEGARALAPTLVGRDPATLDGPGLARAGLESVAENTSDAVVAPFVWGALLGAPGVAAHRALNTMDAMVGHRSERYARFGWASARADDVAGWPAARLAALATGAVAGGLGPVGGHDAGTLDGGAGRDGRGAGQDGGDLGRDGGGASGDGGSASGDGGDASGDGGDAGRADRGEGRTGGSADRPGGGAAVGGPRAAWRAWWRDGAAHPSPNAGRVEAAFAGALGVRLGGRNVYGGRVEERPVLGDVPGARDPEADDLERAARLSLRVGTATAVVCAVGAVLMRRARG